MFALTFADNYPSYALCLSLLVVVLSAVGTSLNGSNIELCDVSVFLPPQDKYWPFDTTLCFMLFKRPIKIPKVYQLLYLAVLSREDVNTIPYQKLLLH